MMRRIGIPAACIGHPVNAQMVRRSTGRRCEGGQVLRSFTKRPALEVKIVVTRTARRRGVLVGCRLTDSSRPTAYKAAALPAELSRHGARIMHRPRLLDSPQRRLAAGGLLRRLGVGGRGQRGGRPGLAEQRRRLGLRPRLRPGGSGGARGGEEWRTWGAAV